MRRVQSSGASGKGSGNGGASSGSAIGGGANPATDPNAITKTDKRYAWIEARVVAAFRVRSLDVLKAFDDENMKRDVQAFLDMDSCRALTVRVSGSSTVVFVLPGPDQNHPQQQSLNGGVGDASKLSKKVLLLEKIGSVKVTPATISSVVVASEAFANSLEAFRLLCAHVYAPLLDAAAAAAPSATEGTALTAAAAAAASDQEPAKPAMIDADDADDGGAEALDPEQAAALKLKDAIRKAVPTIKYPLAASRTGVRDALLHVATEALVRTARERGATVLPGASTALVAETTPKSSDARVVTLAASPTSSPLPVRGHNNASSPTTATPVNTVPRAEAEAYAAQWAGLMQATLRDKAELARWLPTVPSVADSSVSSGLIPLPIVPPAAELAHHESRLTDLEGILSQCSNGRGFHQVRAALERADSPYASVLKRIAADVEAAVDYERGVCKWLGAMRASFEPLSTGAATGAKDNVNAAASGGGLRRVPFHELDEGKRGTIPALMRLLHLTWKHRAHQPTLRFDITAAPAGADDECGDDDSPAARLRDLLRREGLPYTTPLRLTGLVRGVGADLVHAAAAYIDFAENFGPDTEPPEFVSRIQRTFSVFQYFKQAVYVFQDDNLAADAAAEQADEDAKAATQHYHTPDDVADAASDAPHREWTEDDFAVGRKSQQWRVPHAALLSHVDTFLERCRDALDALDQQRVQRYIASIDVGHDLEVAANEATRRFEAAFAALAHDAFPHVTAVDPADPNCALFDRGIAQFKAQVAGIHAAMAKAILSFVEQAALSPATVRLVDQVGVFFRTVDAARPWSKVLANVIGKWECECDLVRREIPNLSGPAQAYHDDAAHQQDLRVDGAVAADCPLELLSEAVTTEVALLRRLDDTATEVESLLAHASAAGLPDDARLEQARRGFSATVDRAHAALEAHSAAWSTRLETLYVAQIDRPLLVRVTHAGRRNTVPHSNPAASFLSPRTHLSTAADASTSAASPIVGSFRRAASIAQRKLLEEGLASDSTGQSDSFEVSLSPQVLAGGRAGTQLHRILASARACFNHLNVTPVSLSEFVLEQVVARHQGTYRRFLRLCGAVADINDRRRKIAAHQRPLLLEEIDRVVETLLPGTESLAWDSEDPVDVYAEACVSDAMGLSKAVETITQRTDAVKTVFTELQGNDHQPLPLRVNRVGDRSMTFGELKVFFSALVERLAHRVEDGGRELRRLATESLRALNDAKASCGFSLVSPHDRNWHRFLLVAQEEAVGEYARFAVTSLGNLRRQCDATTLKELQGLPLLEGSMQIVNPATFKKQQRSTSRALRKLSRLGDSDAVEEDDDDAERGGSRPGRGDIEFRSPEASANPHARRRSSAHRRASSAAHAAGAPDLWYLVDSDDDSDAAGSDGDDGDDVAAPRRDALGRSAGPLPEAYLAVHPSVSADVLPILIHYCRCVGERIAAALMVRAADLAAGGVLDAEGSPTAAHDSDALHNAPAPRRTSQTPSKRPSPPQPEAAVTPEGPQDEAGDYSDDNDFEGDGVAAESPPFGLPIDTGAAVVESEDGDDDTEEESSIDVGVDTVLAVRTHPQVLGALQGVRHALEAAVADSDALVASLSTSFGVLWLVGAPAAVANAEFTKAGVTVPHVHAVTTSGGRTTARGSVASSRRTSFTSVASFDSQGHRDHKAPTPTHSPRGGGSGALQPPVSAFRGIDRHGGGGADGDETPTAADEEDFYGGVSHANLLARYHRYTKLSQRLASDVPATVVLGGWFRVDLKLLKARLQEAAQSIRSLFAQQVLKRTQAALDGIEATTASINSALEEAGTLWGDASSTQVRSVFERLRLGEQYAAVYAVRFALVRQALATLQQWLGATDRVGASSLLARVDAAAPAWDAAHNAALSARQQLVALQAREADAVRASIHALEADIQTARSTLQETALFHCPFGAILDSLSRKRAETAAVAAAAAAAAPETTADTAPRGEAEVVDAPFASSDSDSEEHEDAVTLLSTASALERDQKERGVDAMSVSEAPGGGDVVTDGATTVSLSSSMLCRRLHGELVLTSTALSRHASGNEREAACRVPTTASTVEMPSASGGDGAATTKAMAVYESLDASWALYAGLRDKWDRLRGDEELYELEPTNANVITALRRDIVALKVLWDVAVMAAHQIAEWTADPLLHVDTSTLVDDVARVRDIIMDRPAHVRKWGLFKSADTHLREFAASVPLAQELKSDAMRPRHWEELAVICNAEGVLSFDQEGHPTSTLSELLRLNLPHYAHDVSQLVEMAEKERHIERSLRAINAAWKATAAPVVSPSGQIAKLPNTAQGQTQQRTATEHAAALALVHHAKEMGASLLAPAECLVETLEDHLAQLQAMHASRWVGHFADGVEAAQAKLSTVDTVLEGWAGVQKTLLNLRPIFLSSADMRARLPHQVAAFERTDQRYRAAMATVSAEERMLDLCDREFVVPVAVDPAELEAAARREARLRATSLNRSGSVTAVDAAAAAATADDNAPRTTDGDEETAVASQCSKSTEKVPGTPPDSLAGANEEDAPVSPVAEPAEVASQPTTENVTLVSLLAALLDALAVCEKSLARYLHAKRLVFPRLFFFSDLDLVDLLAHGDDLRLASRHIGKVSDAIESVIFASPKELLNRKRRASRAAIRMNETGDLAGSMRAADASTLMSLSALAVQDAADDDDAVDTGLQRPDDWALHPADSPFSWIHRKSVDLGGNTAVTNPNARVVDCDAEPPAHYATAVVTREGEILPLIRPLPCTGATELWMASLLEEIQHSVAAASSYALHTYTIDGTAGPSEPVDWLFAHTAQSAIVASRVAWTAETTSCLESVEDGNVNALYDLLRKRRTLVTTLIDATLQDQTALRRTALVTLITIEVHQRDVVGALAASNVEAVSAFGWQCQLRMYANPAGEFEERKAKILSQQQRALAGGAAQRQMKTKVSLFNCVMQTVTADICDMQFVHGCEYIGNVGCLVITPLTDRCYITLSQALKLCKGGAPAGPAGTGKTETVKDMARAVGIPVYVFNCSDQMNYATLGAIFAGLAMVGAWGCFDEFNRIAVEVLSVVATQVQAVLDAQRTHASTIDMLGDRISINHDVGVFVTMNPGYKGRTELPENVKTLFRPCAMVVPDVLNIAEIMLSAEGFTTATELATRFVRLYSLCSGVLSAQDQYDWGLRSIRSVLVLAGALRRVHRKADELVVMVCAIRDTNLAKLALHDVAPFRALLTAVFSDGTSAFNLEELPHLRVDSATVASSMPAGFNIVPVGGNADASVMARTASRPQSLEGCLAVAAAQEGTILNPAQGLVDQALRLHDLMIVRHSVFVIGDPLTGKTTLLRTLARALEHYSGQKVQIEVIEPKALSADELYGFVSEQTREWHDGVLSAAFRQFAGTPAAGSVDTPDTTAAADKPQQQQQQQQPAPPSTAAVKRVSIVGDGATSTGRPAGRQRSGSLRGGPPRKSSDAAESSSHNSTRSKDAPPPAGASGMRTAGSKWIVLDGAIDPDWIESMNSVMDDNKLLTLANNERVLMSPEMRLCFEIDSLTSATPATVSRAGILFLDTAATTWVPVKDAWLARRATSERTRGLLDILFDKYAAAMLGYLTSNPGRCAIPVSSVQLIRGLCSLLDGVLDSAMMRGANANADVLEPLFLWCCVWAIGANIVVQAPAQQGTSTDHRAHFSAFVRRETPLIRMPDAGSIFDYCPSLTTRAPNAPSTAAATGASPGNVPVAPNMPPPATRRPGAGSAGRSAGSPRSSKPDPSAALPDLVLKWQRWEEQVPYFNFNVALPLTEQLVPTADVLRTSYLLELLVPQKPDRFHALRLPQDAVLGHFSGSTPPLAGSSVHGRGPGTLGRGGTSPHVALIGPRGCGKTVAARFHFSSRPFADLHHGSGTGPNQEARTTTTSSSAAVAAATGPIELPAFGVRSLLCTGATTAHSVGGFIDSLTEKRLGRQYGPIGGAAKRLVILIEDLNMATPDRYGAASAHAALRLHMTHGFVYDRVRLTQKDIVDVQYVAQFDATGGSGADVDPRLLGRFVTLACGVSSVGSMAQLAEALLSAHLLSLDVRKDVLSCAGRVAHATAEVVGFAMKSFLPTADLFHHEFSLRDLTRIVGGLSRLQANSTPAHLAPAWLHECRRVIGDRLGTRECLGDFVEGLKRIGRAQLGDFDAVDEYLGVVGDEDESDPTADASPAAAGGSPDQARATKAADDMGNDFDENDDDAIGGADDDGVSLAFLPEPRVLGVAPPASGGGSSSSSPAAAASLPPTGLTLRVPMPTAAIDGQNAAAAAGGSSGVGLDEAEHSKVSLSKHFVGAINAAAGRGRYITSTTHLGNAIDDGLTSAASAAVAASAAGGASKLVLFREAAVQMIAVARVMLARNSHALLVGVGGSGRASLTALAAKYVGHELRHLRAATSATAASSRSQQGSNSASAQQNPIGAETVVGPAFDALRQALGRTITHAARKEQKIVLMTSPESVAESPRVLGLIADMVAHGAPRDVFTADEMEELCNQVSAQANARSRRSHSVAASSSKRMSVSGTGGDSRRAAAAAVGKDAQQQAANADFDDDASGAEAAWQHVCRAVRSNVTVVFLATPQRKRLRTLLRNFPALAAHTQIVWFHPWSLAALTVVAERVVDASANRSAQACFTRQAKAIVRDRNPRFADVGLDGASERQQASPGDTASPATVGIGSPAVDRSDGPESERPPAVFAAFGSPAAAFDSVEEQFNVEVESTRADLVRAFCVALARAHATTVATAEAEHARGAPITNSSFTPRTFLLGVEYAVDLVGAKENATQRRLQRYQLGLERLRACGAQVRSLQEQLGVEQDEARDKAQATEALLDRVTQEKLVVEEQNSVAQAEEVKTNRIVDEVNLLVSDCEADLAAAQPMVQAARAALDTLNKNNLTELKSMTKPPPEVQAVAGCVLCLFTQPDGRVPRDRSWSASRRMMVDITRWMRELQEYDVNNIPQQNIDAIEHTVAQANFTPEAMASKSVAASSLCAWVINVVKFHRVRVTVRPKEQRVADAKARLATSRGQLAKVQKRVADLQTRLDAVVAQYTDAVDERDALEQRITLTNAKLARAQRLTASLGGEQTRWGNAVTDISGKLKLLVGEVQIAAALVTYAAPFANETRSALLDGWVRPRQNMVAAGGGSSEPKRAGGRPSAMAFVSAPSVSKLLPVRKGFNPINDVLTGDDDRARWNSDGLPGDEYSIGSAAAVESTGRHVILLDDQLQAYAWLRRRGTRQDAPRKFTTLDATRPNFHRELGYAAERGDDLLVEGCEAHHVQGLLAGLIKLGRRPAILAEADLRPAGMTPGSPSPRSSRPQRSLNVGSDTAKELTVTVGDVMHPVSSNFRMFILLRPGMSSDVLPVSATCDLSVVNFTVTEHGLRDQLLARVVRLERPDLESLMTNLVADMNAMTMDLRACESRLLRDLSEATGDVLENAALVDSLEDAKRQADRLSKAFDAAVSTRQHLEGARATYLPVAARAATLFFAIQQLRHVEEVYQYSIAAFLGTVDKSIYDVQKIRSDAAHAADGTSVGQESEVSPMANRSPSKAQGGPSSSSPAAGGSTDVAVLQQQVKELVAAVTDGVVAYVAAGVFSKHRLTLISIVCINVLLRVGNVNPQTAAFLLKGPRLFNVDVPAALAGSVTEEQYQRLAALAQLGQQQQSAADEAAAIGGGINAPPPPIEKTAAPAVVDKQAAAALEDTDLSPFAGLLEDFAEQARWKSWLTHDEPERAKPPGSFKRLSIVQRLLLIRCVRTDRLPAALRALAGTHVSELCGRADLGSSSATGGSDDYEALLAGTEPRTPLIFLLSPGADPASRLRAACDNVVEREAASAASPTAAAGHSNSTATATATVPTLTLRHVSLGQGQEVVAEEAVGIAIDRGSWLLLHNVHLVPRWGPKLLQLVQGLESHAKLLPPVSSPDQNATSTHLNPPAHCRRFRLLLTAEPVDSLPPLVLQLSTKVVCEPPTGILAKMKGAWRCFESQPWEKSAKPHEYHAIVYALCFVHAALVERARFGPVGWSRRYVFSTEDLTSCGDILRTYLEDRPVVPWADLRFFFAHVIYGGHIVDPWDRRLCLSFFERHVAPDLLHEGELLPGLPLPHKRDWQSGRECIDDTFPGMGDGPALFGLGPESALRAADDEGTAVIAALTDVFSNVIAAVQLGSDARKAAAHGGGSGGRRASNAGGAGDEGNGNHGNGGGAAASGDGLELGERAMAQLESVAMLSSQCPEGPDPADVEDRLDTDANPIQRFMARECVRYGAVVRCVKATLDEADAAIRGLVVPSSVITACLDAIAVDRVPEPWLALWGPTDRGLAAFLLVLQGAAEQLNSWAIDTANPRLIGLHLCISPTALFSSVVLDAADRTTAALETLEIVADVTKRQPEAIDIAPREGAYVFGASLLCAQWDSQGGCLTDAPPHAKGPFPLPVLHLRGQPMRTSTQAAAAATGGGPAASAALSSASAAASILPSNTHYVCPMYRSVSRAQAAYVYGLKLRTRTHSSYWTLRGVALVTDGL